MLEGIDQVPVRLPSGTKAYLFLPEPLTQEDADFISRQVQLFVMEIEPMPLMFDSIQNIEQDFCI